jgi:hypothetical protein
VAGRRTDGAPAVVIERGRRRQVIGLQDGWWIDEEWWRAPIVRRYYQVVLDDGSLRTLFEDLVGGGWWAQHY